MNRSPCSQVFPDSGVARIENPDWLNDKLSALVRLGDELRDGKTTDSYHDFTAMKLIAIRYYASTFSKVVASQKKKGPYDGAVYVDLFAGTGLVSLKSTRHGDVLPGSALCAATLKNPFDYMVCVEKSAKKCEVLKSRLRRARRGGKFTVINGDCNSRIGDVVAAIRRIYRNPIVLAFVDPEGIEIKFSTLRSLSSAFGSCDFIINVNSSGLRRVSGKYARGITGVRGAIQDYVDGDVRGVLEGLARGDPPEGQYAKLITESLGKSMGGIVTIRDTGYKVAYYLLGYTRKTRSGSGYIRTFTELERRLGWADRHDVRKEIEKIQNRQSQMDDFV